MSVFYLWVYVKHKEEEGTLHGLRAVEDTPTFVSALQKENPD